MSLFYLLPSPDEDPDALDEAALNRERARVLLQRYGIVFKALLEREMPQIRWPKLFRTLRLMELSSEIVGGCFFEEIPGIQFADPKALAMLQRDFDDEAVFWINAKDPASLSGLGLAGLNLPPRVASTHLVYRGTELVLVSKRGGRHLDIRVPPNDPRMSRYLTFIDAMLTRDAAPLTLLTIEKINGRAAALSPYRPAFESRFDTAVSHRTLTVARRYGNYG